MVKFYSNHYKKSDHLRRQTYDEAGRLQLAAESCSVRIRKLKTGQCVSPVYVTVINMVFGEK